MSELERRAGRRVGTTLRGKYRIERVIGIGGMATVYGAVHRNGHRVAIKMLHQELSLRDDTRARFLREGYVANMVGHAGAVRVLDDDIAEDGSAFLVMELLRGETLGARARRHGGKLPFGEAIAIGHQILDVLAAAHASGIIHRDIKPENLFITTERVVKVLDFGIARIEDDTGLHATATGTRMGTPAFMPPELALGRTSEIDARTDIWSVGATLFTLISGEIVHDVEAVAEVVVRAATQPARSLSSAVPDVPRSLADVVERALSFARDDRWPSARAMMEALEDAHLTLSGKAISAGAIGPVPHITEPRPVWSGALDPTELPDGTPSDRRFPIGATTQPRSDDAPDVMTPPLPSTPSLGAGSRLSTRPNVTATNPSPSEPRPRTWLTASTIAVAMAAAIGGATWLGLRRSAAPTPPKPAAACTSNAACIAESGGRPAICRKDDGACVALENDLCRVLSEPSDLTNDATLWIGAMYPHRIADPLHYGPRHANAVDLARRDFAETSGGLPPQKPGGPRRPIGVVLCDDAKAPERAAAHLVDDVRVPAIIGFATSKEVLDLASTVFLPKGILALTANTASMLRDIPHPPGEPRLVWRLYGATDMVSWPISAVIEHVIEPELRAIRGLLEPGEPVRIAQLRQNTLAGHSTVDSRIATVRFNGKSVAENGDAFRQFMRADLLENVDIAATNAHTASDIAAFQPHIILDLPPIPALLAAVEEHWPAKARFRPRYLTEGTWTDLGGASFDWKRFGLSKRIFSVDNVSSGAALVKYALRYNEFFSPKVTPATAPNAPYDGFYLFAYAAAALGGEPITGRALARAMTRLLPPGDPIDVGPSGIYPAYYALASGKHIDLQGAATSLDYDVETGETPADFALYCLVPATNNEPSKQIESGLVLDPKRKRIVGSPRCP